ncbi:hypothetical protein F66182_11474, partial [Fusarium sp. NRRL 66182]
MSSSILNRSARSTPAINASAFSPPGEAASSSSQERVPFMRDNSPEAESLPSNPAATPVVTHGDNMASNRNSDADTVAANHPTIADYDRYWRSDRDRYTARRGPYPPPTFMNRRRAYPQDSDEEFYSSDDPRIPRDPYDSYRGRRMMDEEMGFFSRPGHHRRTSTVNGFNISTGKLEWNNLSAQEKSEIMRLPLTQWMNSDFKNHFVASLGELIGTTMFLFFAFAGTEVANIQTAT